MSSYLFSLAEARRSGSPVGITSVCSAHPTVLRAALRRARQTGRHVLIEATCNQVNHLGGYTGMTPADFVGLVGSIADEEALNRDVILFGGDHLGPNPWRREPAKTACDKAGEMVAAYVSAGFTKIHLDASMACADDVAPLSDQTIAERAAILCAIAENTARENGSPPPVYILGTEVPVPGGADHALVSVEPTSPEAAASTIAIHRTVFEKAGLGDAFSRVIAFVVQPGVEFGSEDVVQYEPSKAVRLSHVLDRYDALVFEAHSTDYQSDASLSALVRDGYPILKVGPGLTFAYREALYALDMIASELRGTPERSLERTMERLMLAYPEDWHGHYHGDATSLRLQRHYSYSDRIRYYWNRPEAVAAVKTLLSGLRDQNIPEPLLHQYLPWLETSAAKSSSVDGILIAAVDQVLDSYDRAITQAGV